KQVEQLQTRIHQLHAKHQGEMRGLRTMMERSKHERIFFEGLAYDQRERIRVLERRIASMLGGRSIAREVAGERADVRAQGKALLAKNPRLRRSDLANRIGFGGSKPDDPVQYSGAVPASTAYKYLAGIGFGAHRRNAKSRVKKRRS